MSTPITITPDSSPAPEPTEAERNAKALVNDADLALRRFVVAIDQGYRQFWGSPDSPRERDSIVADLDALGAEQAGALFTRHAIAVTFLAENGLASFDPWELVTPYEVTFNPDGTITVGEILAAEWSTA